MKRSHLTHVTRLLFWSAFFTWTTAACRNDNRMPNPNPTPNPEVVDELKVEPSIVGGLVKEGRFFGELTNVSEMQLALWTSNGELNTMKSQGTTWVFDGKPDLVKMAKTTRLVAMIGEQKKNMTINDKGFSYTPPVKKDHTVGECTVSHFYEDVLIGTVETQQQKKVALTMSSPFKQLHLVVANSKWPQVVSNITLEIGGALTEAAFDGTKWSGNKQPISIEVKNKEKWEQNEAVEIWLVVPTQDEELKIKLAYENTKGKQLVEQTIKLTDVVTSIRWTLDEEPLNNPPLDFTPPIDVEYWKRANKEAYNLITANFGGKLSEEEARRYGWNQVRPLVDEKIGSKLLYKDDMNVITWMADMKKDRQWKHRDWGYAIGLETLDGQLVEVYPPQYYDYVGGGQRGGGAGGYQYTTVPEGKYRLVVFVSYAEEWAGEEESKKWYQLPMLDALTGYECLNTGIEEYRKRYLEPVPMSKSPYKDMDIVEVKDRRTNHLVAPRWYMGKVYHNQKDYKNGDNLNKVEMPIHRYVAGNVVEVLAVNTTNQTLRGTVIAKAEYLPMFNPVGQWRLDQTASYSPVWGVYGRKGDYYSTSWSKEMGRVEATISPNSEQNIAVVVSQVDKKWKDIGKRGSAHLGPETFIHFYWVDEIGKETMMMMMDYPMMNRMQQLGYGGPNNKNLDWNDLGLLSQDIDQQPSIGVGWTANGFVFW